MPTTIDLGHPWICHDANDLAGTSLLCKWLGEMKVDKATLYGMFYKGVHEIFPDLSEKKLQDICKSHFLHG